MNSIVFRGLLGKKGPLPPYDPKYIKKCNCLIEEFPFVLKKAREWHQGEIVLATWDNQPLEFDKKLVDKIIILPDVGKTEGSKYFAMDNTKRQLTLANAGVREASGEKIFLTRTDMVTKGDVFKFVKDDRLVIPALLTRDPDHRGPYAQMKDRDCYVPENFTEKNFLNFCPSDLSQCGFAKNVKNWASKDVMDLVLKNVHTGLSIEQLWCIAYVNIFRGFDIDFNDPMNQRGLEMQNTLPWEILCRNFKVKDLKTLKIQHLQSKYNNPNYQSGDRWLTEKTFNEQELLIKEKDLFIRQMNTAEK
jgi:hypothetical protein